MGLRIFSQVTKGNPFILSLVLVSETICAYLSDLGNKSVHRDQLVGEHFSVRGAEIEIECVGLATP